MSKKILSATVFVWILLVCPLEAAVVYEVWAGDTDYSDESYPWEYYYNIDQQDYVKLGESDGQSKTFLGNYHFYVIAAREKFFLDSIQGSTGDFYAGYGGLITGNTFDFNNILGSPDNQYATVGYQSSGGTFRGYVVITNPGYWTGLTVITGQPVTEIVESLWVGGEEGSWEQAGNWNPPLVPNNTTANSFNVTIGDESSYVEIGLEQSRTVNQIICYGEVGLSRWTPYWILLTLTGTNGIINYGNLDLNDMEIDGNVTNKSGACLFGGDMGLENGDIVNEAGAKIETDGAIDIDNGAVYNDGDILIAPGGGIWAENEFQNDGTITIYDAGCSGDTLFLNDSNGVIEGYGMIHAEDVILNKGLIRSVGGGLNLHGRSTYGAWPAQGYVANTGTLANSSGTTLTVMADVPDFNNTGTILVRSNGAIVFDNSNLRNEPSGTILLRGGSLEASRITNAQGAQFNGLGSISADLAVESNSSVHFTGPSVIYGDVTISAGATLQISDGQTLITGRTTNNGTIHLIGGTIIFQGGYTGDGQIINEAGADRNHFDVNADGIENIKDLAVFAENWLWTASWY